MLILITGGWSENEEIINIISNTMFWLLWWQESKRGGYYRLEIVNKIKILKPKYKELGKIIEKKDREE